MKDFDQAHKNLLESYKAGNIGMDYIKRMYAKVADILYNAPFKNEEFFKAEDGLEKVVGYMKDYCVDEDGLKSVESFREKKLAEIKDAANRLVNLNDISQMGRNYTIRKLLARNYLSGDRKIYDYFLASLRELEKKQELLSKERSKKDEKQLAAAGSNS